MSRRDFFLIAAGTALLGAGCGNESGAKTAGEAAIAAPLGSVDPRGPVEFVDAHGRLKTFETPPVRIAAGINAAVETLLYLGVKPVLRPDSGAGVPPGAGSIPTLPITHGVGPDMEAIAVARPDAFVMHAHFGQFAAGIEDTLGVPTLLYEVRDLESLRLMVRGFGDLTGKRDRAEALLHDVESSFARHAAQKPGSGLKVLAIFDAGGTRLVIGRNTLLGQMLLACGVDLIAPAEKGTLLESTSMIPCDIEQVVVEDPDCIFVVTHTAAHAGAHGPMGMHPVWRSLRAVESGNLYNLDEDLYFTNAGPRLPKAIDALAAMLREASENLVAGSE